MAVTTRTELLRAIRWAAPIAASVALACSGGNSARPAPTDRFYYPTGIAIRHEPPGCAAGSAGCQTQLLVVSSNFDLAYDAATGGSVISVDVGQAFTAAAQPGAQSPLPLQPLGMIQIGSFGGEVTIADAETCPGWSRPPEALVASRDQMKLYRLAIDGHGALSCGSDCPVQLGDSNLADPYGVTLACGTYPAIQGAPPSQQALAFVTYLRSVDAHGWLSEIDLLATDAAGLRRSPSTLLDLQVGPSGQSVFDPATLQLFVTGRFAQAGYAPLRWIDLATPGTAPASVNLFNTVRGSDLRGIALSSDRTRAYVGIRLYDLTTAQSIFARPANDLAGALLVIDLASLMSGSPTSGVLRVVPLDRGVTEVRTIARTGRRDLVAVSAADDSTLTLYDDDTGAIAKTFSVCGALSAEPDVGVPPPCIGGLPLTGLEPYGLAVEPIAGGLVRLYVGAFDSSWINVIAIDPANPNAPPAAWIRIGPERM